MNKVILKDNVNYILDETGLLLDSESHRGHDTGDWETLVLPEGITAITKDSVIPAFFEIYLPDSLISIGDFTFAHCHAIQKVHFGNSLVAIGEKAFFWCEELDDVILPDSLTSIGTYAFADCIFLKTVRLSNSLTHLPEGLFSSCMNLEFLEIPYSVRSVGNESVAKNVTIDAIRECELREDLEVRGATVTIRPRTKNFH